MSATPSPYRRGRTSPHIKTTTTPTASRKNKKRDDSVANETTRFQRHLEETLEKVRDIWDFVGMEDNARGERFHSVYTALIDGLDLMVAEETEIKEQLAKAIIDYQKQVLELCGELGIPDVYPPEDLEARLDKEVFLRRKRGALKAERDKRMARLAELMGEDEKLCEKLHTDTYYIPADTTPTEEELQALETHVDEMQQLLACRKTELKEKKRRIMFVMRKIEYVPHTEFEKILVSEEEQNIPLSFANIELLRALSERVEGEYAEFLKNIRRRISEVKQELEIWWDKCHVSQAERSALPAICEDNYSEEALNTYRREVEKWSKYFEERQVLEFEVLEKVAQWETLFEEFIKGEVRQRDPSRYQNRGGKLQEELAYHRSLQKHKLPRAIQEVAEAVEAWSGDHQRGEFLVNGQPPMEYISRIKREYEEQKQEKNTKSPMAAGKVTGGGRKSSFGGNRHHPYAAPNVLLRRSSVCVAGRPPVPPPREPRKPIGRPAQHISSVTLIPGGLLPGKAIVFKGMALAGKGKSFALNLCCGLLVDGDYKGNIAFQFNPRFDENKVVLNALVNDKWGPEERYDNPFKMGQAFEIRILALTDVIQVVVNGRHFCDFRHRLALAEVKTLFVKGCIRLDCIQFEGDQSISPYSASNAGQQQQQAVQFQAQPTHPQEMQFQPQPQFQAQRQLFQPQAQAPYAGSYSPLACPTGSQPPLEIPPIHAYQTPRYGGARREPTPSEQITMDFGDSGDRDDPLTMIVDSSEDEITFRTPPGVVKKRRIKPWKVQ